MRRLLARAALAALVVGVIVAMAWGRTDTTIGVPFYGKHDVPILAMFITCVLVVLALAVAVAVLVKLVQWAEL